MWQNHVGLLLIGIHYWDSHRLHYWIKVRNITTAYFLQIFAGVWIPLNMKIGRFLTELFEKKRTKIVTFFRFTVYKHIASLICWAYRDGISTVSSQLHVCVCMCFTGEIWWMRCSLRVHRNAYWPIASQPAGQSATRPSITWYSARVIMHSIGRIAVMYIYDVMMRLHLETRLSLRPTHIDAEFHTENVIRPYHSWRFHAGSIGVLRILSLNCYQSLNC